MPTTPSTSNKTRRGRQIKTEPKYKEKTEPNRDFSLWRWIIVTGDCISNDGSFFYFFLSFFSPFLGVVPCIRYAKSFFVLVGLIERRWTSLWARSNDGRRPNGVDFLPGNRLPSSSLKRLSRYIDYLTMAVPIIDSIKVKRSGGASNKEKKRRLH